MCVGVCEHIFVEYVCACVVDCVCVCVSVLCLMG